MPFFYPESKLEQLLHFFASLVAVLLDVVSLAMIVRMIYSLIADAENSRFAIFLTCITEPFIVPVRFLLAKFNVLQNSPIDWSFTISYLVIMLLRMMLPAVG